MFGRNNDGDQAELLARRMEQYEQTLRVMYQRITESRSHLHALGFNYEQLMVSHRTEIGKIIEGLYSGNDNVERATGTEGDLCSMVPNGRAGRPDFNEKVMVACKCNHLSSLSKER